MMKNYDLEFSKGFQDFFKGVRETGNKLNDLIDKLVVWVLSLSTGAIVLIISSIDKITFTDKKSVGWIVILLAVSVVSGIIGRFAFTIAIYLNHSLSSNFDAAFMLDSSPHYYPHQLRGDETAEEIFELTKISFDLDLNLLVEARKTMSDEQKIDHNQHARILYEDIKSWVKEEQQEALARVIEKMNNALGIEIDTNSSSDTNSNRRKRRWESGLENTAFGLFGLSTAMFITALIYSVLKFLEQ